MSNQAFFGDPADVQSAAVGAEYILRGPEAHHAVTVKRVMAGESVDVLDGEGRRLICTVVDPSPAAVVLSVNSVGFDPLPELRIILVQALAKGDRAEMAVEAATELGVDAVVPWQSDRSIVRWRAEKAAKGQAKWESLVRSASKQCRRTRVPEVLAMVDTRGLARWLDGAEHVALLHEEAQQSLAGFWSAEATPPSGTLVVIVGPEGGVSPQEVDMLQGAGAVPVVLGRNVLRASTAGPAALAVLNQLSRRW